MKKIAKNCHLKNGKNYNFWQFKKSQVFGNFFTVKWQFCGGADTNSNIMSISICMRFHGFFDVINQCPLYSFHNKMFLFLLMQGLCDFAIFQNTVRFTCV